MFGRATITLGIGPHSSIVHIVDVCTILIVVLAAVYPLRSL